LAAGVQRACIDNARPPSPSGSTDDDTEQPRNARCESQCAGDVEGRSDDMRCPLWCLVWHICPTKTPQGRLQHAPPPPFAIQPEPAAGDVSLSAQSIMSIAVRGARPCCWPAADVEWMFQNNSPPYKTRRLPVCDMTMMSHRTALAVLAIRCHTSSSQTQHHRGHIWRSSRRAVAGGSA
jgi:hypothetical protein